ncbi:MAG: ATP-binding protein [Planctomycetota bacterium]
MRGQETAKRALTVAAAGGHGLLFLGPPGTGKSLLARSLADLLPHPSFDELLDITRVRSVTSRWPAALATRRPFRAPHPTTSSAGLVGGGSPPAPGEITLAHRGVLFLDELPEWRRDVLETLRQPLEEGRVTLSRAARRLELPARFQLIAAMNPCPCGYRGHPRTPCRCSSGEVRRYHQRISGPLLDRVDLRIELPAPSLEELMAPPRPRASAASLRERVTSAARRAHERQGPIPNARVGTALLDRVAAVPDAARPLLEQAVLRHSLSARAVQALRRVARTLADLEDEASVSSRHLAGALALRIELGVAGLPAPAPPPS